jgi:hypothetical protein
MIYQDLLDGIEWHGSESLAKFLAATTGQNGTSKAANSSPWQLKKETKCDWSGLETRIWKTKVTIRNAERIFVQDTTAMRKSQNSPLVIGHAKNGEHVVT